MQPSLGNLSSTVKLALVLQFHPGDRDTAMRLARMIADIEQLPRDDVQFYFAARYDAAHDDDTVNYVRTKFPCTETITTFTKLTGWPQGPNAMAQDILLLFDKKRDVDGLFLIEPDVVPLRKYWLNILIDEWLGAIAAGKIQLGAWRGSGPPGGHLNGNCILIPRIATWLRERGFEVGQMAGGIAWDCQIAAWTREYWATTGIIKNKFQSHKATEDDLLTPDLGDDPPAIIHGYKDDSAYLLARKMLSLDEIDAKAKK